MITFGITPVLYTIQQQQQQKPFLSIRRKAFSYVWTIIFFFLYFRRASSSMDAAMLPASVLLPKRRRRLYNVFQLTMMMVFAHREGRQDAQADESIQTSYGRTAPAVPTGAAAAPLLCHSISQTTRQRKFDSLYT